jgi:hypothetical protein
MAENRNWETHFGESRPHRILKNLSNGLGDETRLQTEGQKNRRDIKRLLRAKNIKYAYVETAVGFKALYYNISPRESYRRAKSHMVKFLSKQWLCVEAGGEI